MISFLYFLQVARNICDTILGAGLLGEISVGVIYGPIAKILNIEWQETFLAIGYIGLILIVFGEYSPPITSEWGARLTPFKNE